MRKEYLLRGALVALLASIVVSVSACGTNRSTIGSTTASPHPGNTLVKQIDACSLIPKSQIEQIRLILPLDNPLIAWYNFANKIQPNSAQALKGRVTVAVAPRERAAGGKPAHTHCEKDPEAARRNRFERE